MLKSELKSVEIIRSRLQSLYRKSRSQREISEINTLKSAIKHLRDVSGYSLSPHEVCAETIHSSTHKTTLVSNTTTKKPLP